MRFLSTLVVLVVLGCGVYWVTENRPELKSRVLEIVNTKSVQVLEARFTAQQVLEKERIALIKGDAHHYADPILKFQPYLLMEVKFVNKEFKTEEGVILWDLVDGEMVTDTRTWEKTHGFADCIKTNAERHEYTILKAIAQNKGRANRQILTRALSLNDNNLVDSWIDRACKKKLVIFQGDDYRIHLHNPRIDVRPSTYVSYPLVVQNCKCNEYIAPHYTPKKVIKAAEAAFGSDFAIRSAKEIFLPVYSITAQDSNGSHHTTHWNAVSGKSVCYFDLSQ